MDDDGRTEPIYKLAEDYMERYGDGGGGKIEYPVYFSTRTSLTSIGGVGARLSRVLNAIDACRMDVQPNGIVHDIIDPSLNSRMLDETEMKEFLAQKLIDEEKPAMPVIQKKTDTHLYLYYADYRNLEKFKWNGNAKEWQLEGVVRSDAIYGLMDELDEDFFDLISDGSVPWIALPPGLEGLKLAYQIDNPEYPGDWIDSKARGRQKHLAMQSKRGAFQWVPTWVHCSFDAPTNLRTAKFLGDIAGLPPRRFCEGLYKDIESTVSSMLYLLAKLPLTGRKPDTVPHPQLQNGQFHVVVKAQKYVLPPHSSYTGRWHTEGFTENIAAASVYYIDVSSETTGGNLSFRPRETASAGYVQGRVITPAQNDTDEESSHWWYYCIKDITVTSGTAVAFCNSIPHRFRTIQNETDQEQELLLIYFFIVDPDKPLSATTASVPTRYLLHRAVSHCLDISEPRICQTVIDFSGVYGSTLHHKVVRDRARESMCANRAHWEVHHYGNSGTVEYHGDSRPLGHNVVLDMHGRQRRGEESIENEHSGCNSSALGSGL